MQKKKLNVASGCFSLRWFPPVNWQCRFTVKRSASHRPCSVCLGTVALVGHVWKKRKLHTRRCECWLFDAGIIICCCGCGWVMMGPVSFVFYVWVFTGCPCDASWLPTTIWIYLLDCVDMFSGKDKKLVRFATRATMILQTRIAYRQGVVVWLKLCFCCIALGGIPIHFRAAFVLYNIKHVIYLYIVFTHDGGFFSNSHCFFPYTFDTVNSQVLFCFFIFF